MRCRGADPPALPHHPALAVFIFVNAWSIFIHDSDMLTGHPFETIINGPAHHTLHHIYFTVNYGQYFTFSDKVRRRLFFILPPQQLIRAPFLAPPLPQAGGSYRQPESHLDPIHEVERIEREKEKRAKADAKAELEIVEVVQEEDPTQE